MESFMHPIASMTDVRTVLRTLRKKAGLSQEALAQVTGLSRTAIQSLERGQETVQVNTLFAVLRALNITMNLSHPLLDKDPVHDA
ncbi:MAG: helix-turn-helix domain-containing protein [Alphaproteobacteria bacterium]